jgi:hypothetical protein
MTAQEQARGVVLDARRRAPGLTIAEVKERTGLSETAAWRAFGQLASGGSIHRWRRGWRLAAGRTGRVLTVPAWPPRPDHPA